MRIREYQLDKIEEARHIQQECLRLHLPCPPVLHWAYDIKAPDGDIVEIGHGKANSYTRNALNIITENVGMCAYNVVNHESFSDGFINIKLTEGTIYAYYNSYLGRYQPTASASNPQTIVGSGTTSESLDDYTWPTCPMTDGGTNVASSWDSTNRKMITTIIGTFLNGTGASVNITEAAIRMSIGGSYYVLMVHDVFEAIAVSAGATLTWTYTTEVAYPNP